MTPCQCLCVGDSSKSFNTKILFQDKGKQKFFKRRFTTVLMLQENVQPAIVILTTVSVLDLTYKISAVGLVVD